MAAYDGWIKERDAMYRAMIRAKLRRKEAELKI
jgi:hypothetical protein